MGTEQNDRELRRVMAGVVAEVENISSTVSASGVSLNLVGELRCLDIQAWLWMLERDYVVLRADVTRTESSVSKKGDLLIFLCVPNAISLAGMLVGTSPKQLALHRQQELVDWHDAGYKELGERLFKGLSDGLRDILGPYVRLAYARHGHVRPGFDGVGVLGVGDKAIYECRLVVDGHEQSTAFLVLDATTAVAWNGGDPLFLQAAGPAGPAVAGPQGAPRAPAAEPPARLGAVVESAEARQVVEACGRRLNRSVVAVARSQESTAVGYEVMVVEAPPGTAEPFAFAAAVKHRHPKTVVVLLLHAPTRERVIQALQTRADATLGWPSTDEQLAAKLDSILAALNSQPS